VPDSVIIKLSLGYCIGLFIFEAAEKNRACVSTVEVTATGTREYIYQMTPRQRLRRPIARQKRPPTGHCIDKFTLEAEK